MKRNEDTLQRKKNEIQALHSLMSAYSRLRTQFQSRTLEWKQFGPESLDTDQSEPDWSFIERGELYFYLNFQHIKFDDTDL